jgi:formylglycine-generating enzyme required for sulfatase activity
VPYLLIRAARSASGHGPRLIAAPVLVLTLVTAMVSYCAGAELTATASSTLSGSNSISFAWIPPGTFTMGLIHPGSEADETVVHDVGITKGFYLSATEVTQEQWRSVMETTPWDSLTADAIGPDRPAVQVSWEDVQSFLERLNEREGKVVFRLPTEAEWEYACREGEESIWPPGGRDAVGDYGWHRVDGRSGPADVAKKLASRWGLFDMHGNVWEWCQDRVGAYPEGSVSDPRGRSRGRVRAVRGGSYRNGSFELRCTNRGRMLPGEGHRLLGFRVVREP